jgi:hypothetical protein
MFSIDLKTCLVIITRGCRSWGTNSLILESVAKFMGFGEQVTVKPRLPNEVGAHKSTISRELKRNITFVRTTLGSWQYKPNYPQGYADEKQRETQARELMIT